VNHSAVLTVASSGISTVESVVNIDRRAADVIVFLSGSDAGPAGAKLIPSNKYFAPQTVTHFGGAQSTHRAESSGSETHV
jgi:hypothetical protein